MGRARADERIRHRSALAALSELFLDTAIDRNGLLRICRTLRETGYSDRQLRRIYTDELAPVLHWNLRSPAGVWDGFDIGWLERRCEAARRRAAALRRLPVVGRSIEALLTKSTIDEFERLMQLFRDGCREG